METWLTTTVLPSFPPKGTPQCRKKNEPTYQKHKASGQARTVIDGKSISLGKYNSPESQEQFDDLKTEWRLRQDVTRYTLTVDDLALRYLEHCEVYYRKNDEPTGEAGNIRRALRFVVEHHGRMRARKFGTDELRAVREAIIAAGFVRLSINN